MSLEERQAFARELVEEGWTVREIADLLEVSHVTVVRYLRAAGLGPELWRILPTGSHTPSRIRYPEAWVRAEEMLAGGASFADAVKETGLGETTLRRDLRLRELRAQHLPGFEVYHSLRHSERSIACDVDTAPVAIRNVELDLARLLGRIYELNDIDCKTLHRVLVNALLRLEGYDERENS